MILISSCNNDNIDTYYIKQNMWQYSNGEPIGDGDFIDFDSSFYEIKNDTLLYKEKVIAIVCKLKKDDNLLILKSLINGNTSEYINVNEFVSGPSNHKNDAIKPKTIIMN